MTTLVPISIPAWMLMAIPVLLILSIYTILRNKDQKKSNSDIDEQTTINWIEKKDLLYWLIIICLGAISIFSFKYRKADEMIDHWGFAGTIISIILAVLAIIYTYYQSATTVDSTKRLERSAKKVQKATARVEKATEELESNDIRIIVNDLEERLNKILQEVKQGIKDDIDENITNPLRDLVNFKQTPLDKNLYIFSDENWKEYIENNIDNEEKIISTEGLTILYVYYLYENNKIYSHENIKKMLESIGYEKNSIMVGCGVLQGQVRLLASLNMLQYRKIDEDAQVAEFTSIDDILKNEIETIVNKKEENVTRLLDVFEGLFKK